MNELEEGGRLQLDFGKIAKVALNCPDVIPVAVQDVDTGEVILVAYTNALAFRKALQKRSLILWSTARNELWEKGKTSGQTFELVEVHVNCEQNALLYRVRRCRAGSAGREHTGGVCHTKNRRGRHRDCFYRRVNPETLELETVDP